MAICHINKTYENKVLAINKNSSGCSVYFYSFLLVQYLQVCFKGGITQEPRISPEQAVPSLTEHAPTGSEHCRQSWVLVIGFTDSPRKGEGMNQVHHLSRVHPGHPVNRSGRQGCSRCNVGPGSTPERQGLRQVDL